MTGAWRPGTKQAPGPLRASQDSILARSSKKTSSGASKSARTGKKSAKQSGVGKARGRKAVADEDSELIRSASPGLSVDEYAQHLRDEPAGGAKSPAKETAPRGAGWSERWADWKVRFSEFLERVHKRGRERLTIMVIPHTEQKILNAHVSLYMIFASSAVVVIVLIVSMVSLVGKSGEDIQFYDMGLTNSQFNIQSVKMAEEMIPLHERVTEYASTIAELYVKLDGDEATVLGQGGVAQGVIDSEVSELKELVSKCRDLGDDCDQELTEEILRRVIYLSKQDNHNLTKAVEISDKILAELGTREKQNLLRNTPSIWPTRGYLYTPYGLQADALRGREVFQRGVQIGAARGTEVYATAPGEITDVRFDASYGLQIQIRHRYGLATFYAHLDRARVQKGDEVTKGQVIGYVGQSGRASIPMLYYEVHVGTVAYNPHAFLNHLQDLWLIQPRT
ncbi:MAG: M23 family metallopeptidase [bacterium]|nr:M23 family metallopeptidase [bacterium]